MASPAEIRARAEESRTQRTESMERGKSMGTSAGGSSNPSREQMERRKQALERSRRLKSARQQQS